MNQRKFLIGVWLAIAAVMIIGGNSNVNAQPPPDATAATPAARIAGTRELKPAYERRQEAKKRLKEAIETRKARRLDVPDLVTPDKPAPGKAVKGGKP